MKHYKMHSEIRYSSMQINVQRIDEVRLRQLLHDFLIEISHL